MFKALVNPTPLNGKAASSPGNPLHAVHENPPSLRLSGFDEVEGVIDEPGHVLGAVVVKVQP